LRPSAAPARGAFGRAELDWFSAYPALTPSSRLRRGSGRAGLTSTAPDGAGPSCVADRRGSRLHSCWARLLRPSGPAGTGETSALKPAFSSQQSAISPERHRETSFDWQGGCYVFHECRTISKAMICGKTIRLGRRSKHARDSALRPTCGALTRDRRGKCIDGSTTSSLSRRAGSVELRSP